MGLLPNKTSVLLERHEQGYKEIHHSICTLPQRKSKSSSLPSTDDRNSRMPFWQDCHGFGHRVWHFQFRQQTHPHHNRSPYRMVRSFSHTWCCSYHASYDDNALCMFDYIFLVSAIRNAMYNKCMHLYNMQAPSNANEYGGYTSFRSGECLHYWLHPPPSDKQNEQLPIYYINLIQQYIDNVSCKRTLIKCYLTTLQLPWLHK